jgi:hypothetical protein
MAKALGRLQRVDLRQIWSSEAAEFTPWLASDENLALLSEVVGLDLELEAQERNVGPFRADILCKDVDTGHWVLIENQLERTDHSHLGQLLTYASGLQAVTIIWIAAQFSEQHRATLDWLNEITDERFSFFGLEVELWKIGDSLAAPNFKVVAKPNDWSREVGQAARRIESEALTSTKQKQLAFWTELQRKLQESKSPVRPRKPFPQHWMDFSVGRAGFWTSATLHSAEKRAGVELNVRTTSLDADFAAFKAQQAGIEQKIGQPLVWLDRPGRKSRGLAVFRTGIDPLDEEKWPELLAWMQASLERFDAVFRPMVQELEGQAMDPEQNVPTDGPTSS